MRKKFKIIILSLCMALICAAIPIGIFASADEPIIITGYEQLKNIGKDESSLSGNYKLGNDITIVGTESITPIGDSEHPFKGTFDGAGYTIKNLKIAASESSVEDPSQKNAITYVGLFGVVDSNAKISNLKLSNVSFTDISKNNKYIGYIAGYNKGTIEKCATNLTKTCFDNDVNSGFRFGAITSNNEGKISQCYNSCDLTYGYDYLAFGTIGGIVGINTSSGEVLNSFNTGNIAAKGPYNISAVGGIAGKSQGKVSSVYNAGLISGYNSGSVVGAKSGSNATLENAYYLEGTALVQYSKGNENGKMSFNNMKDLSNLNGLSSFTWVSSTGSYPFPILKDVEYEEFSNSSEFAGGNGRFYNPYQITNTTQLNKINDELSASYKLNNDILFTQFEFNSSADNSFDELPTAPAGAFYNDNKKWIPIGLTTKEVSKDGNIVTDTYTRIFSGSLDGNNYTIYNLQVNNNGNPTDSYAGLFANNGGLIYNLNLKTAPTKESSETDEQFKTRISEMIDRNEYGSETINTTIKNYLKTKSIDELAYGSSFESESSTGKAVSGSIAGNNAFAGRISNVKNDAPVSASETKTADSDVAKELATSGGIVGINEGIISNSRNEGRIKANSSTYYSIAGGITGSNKGYLSSCINTGTVYTGFIGDITDINYFFKNVYLASGGIAGKSKKAVDSSDNEIVLIDGCKNIGGVINKIETESTNDTVYAGAIVGDGEGEISNCSYWRATAARANENRSDSLETNLSSFDKVSSSGITDYKQDYFFKLDVPDAPSEGYNNDNYETYINQKLTSSSGRAKLYKNTEDNALPIAEITKEYTPIEGSKYIQVRAKMKEDTSESYRLSGTYDFIIMLAPQKLIVDSSGAKTIYYVGEEFSDEGLVVTAQFDDGTTQVIHRGSNETDYSISGFDNNTTGSQELTISYNGASIPVENSQYTVNVYDTNFTFAPISSKFMTGHTFTDKDFIARIEYGPSDNKQYISVEYKANETMDGYEVDIPFTSIDSSKPSTGEISLKATYNGKSATAKFVIVEMPVAITKSDSESSIKIDESTKIISGITTGTRLADLKSDINESDFIKVYNGSTLVTDNNAILGTGYVIRLVVEGKTVKQYKLSVLGDLTVGGIQTGDGATDIVDLVAVRCNILEKNILRDEFFLAGDMNGDGLVDIVDLVKIRCIILGKS